MKKTFSVIMTMLLAMVVASCGGNTPAGGREAQELSGAGATFPLPFYNVVFEQFAQLKKNYRKVLLSAMDRNSYWVDNFVVNYLLGKDMHQGYMAEIANITAKDFCSFVDKLYRRGNRITVVMEGTTQDVNTQNLFRENQFIRDYFDL